MRTLATISDHTVNPAAPEDVDRSGYTHRQAARAVLLNDTGAVALLSVKNGSFHKLPGGGIETGENSETALGREVLEEVGCHMTIEAEIGQIIEYRDQWRQIQVSYCYVARQRGDVQTPAFTKQEIADGFRVIWAPSLEAAVTLLANDHPAGYDGQHMVTRDLAFLQAAQQLLATGHSA